MQHRIKKSKYIVFCIYAFQNDKMIYDDAAKHLIDNTEMIYT